jgi:hypothetical protein
MDKEPHNVSTMLKYMYRNTLQDQTMFSPYFSIYIYIYIYKSYHTISRNEKPTIYISIHLELHHKVIDQ